MKNLRAWMVLPSLFAILVSINPILASTASAKDSVAVPALQPAGVADEKKQNGPNQEEIEAVYKELMLDAYFRVPQALKSKILALNLMVSNGQIKLAKQKDHQAFTVALESVSSAWKKYCTPTGNEGDIAIIFELNQQIVSYLVQIVKKDLNNIKPFVFKPSVQQQQLSLGDLFQKMELFAKTYHALELSMNDVGKTRFDKFKRWAGEINRRGNLGAKVFGVGVATFIASLLRYSMKPMPQHVRDEHQRYALHPAPVGAPAVNNDGIWHKMATSDIGTKIGNNEFVQWFDNTIIGIPPYQMPHTHSNNFDFSRPLIAGTGTGVFGTLDKAKTPLLFAVGLPLMLKAFSDKIVDGVGGYKALYRDPKEFVKFRELFHNEKQQISPIEQLWIQGAIERTIPSITFDDIAGLHEQKRELIPVINYLLNPELFEKTGTSVEKGYLFYGPTRTGKTYLAEALAGELMRNHGKELTFLKVNAGEMRMVGIKKVIDVIKKYAPCIVFIDELDLLNLQRDRNSDMLEQILTSMKQDDGKQIIFLAATNRLDHLDQALLQPGRFGKIIPFENPSFKDRREFYDKELRRKHLDPKMVNLDRLAAETEDCSYGDLSSILNHALSKSMQNRQAMSYEHFESGIDAFKRKIVESNLQIPVEERNIITAHLAGHALAYSLLTTGEVLHKVTMMPIHKKIIEERIWYSDNATGPKKIIGYGDVFNLHKQNTAGFDSIEQRMNKMKALLAGSIAEKLLLGATAYNYHDDMEPARQIAESIVFKGLKKEHFSRNAADAKLNEVQKLIEQCEAEVTQLLTTHKEALKKLAAAINEHGTLMSHEVQAILQGHNPGPNAQPIAK